MAQKVRSVVLSRWRSIRHPPTKWSVDLDNLLLTFVVEDAWCSEPTAVYGYMGLPEPCDNIITISLKLIFAHGLFSYSKLVRARSVVTFDKPISFTSSHLPHAVRCLRMRYSSKKCSQGSNRADLISDLVKSYVSSQRNGILFLH